MLAARLQANKLDCAADICNPALLLTKVESAPSYVDHLSFITQIPSGFMSCHIWMCHRNIYRGILHEL